MDAPQKSAGLTAADAEARLAVYGKNVLTPPKQRPLWLQFLLKARLPPPKRRLVKFLSGRRGLA